MKALGEAVEKQDLGEHRGVAANTRTVPQMERVEKAVAVLDDAIQQFNPQWVFALFSGGHDSLTSSYVASLHPAFSGCVHINTGIGIPATRQFVIDTCAERGWPLKEYKATEHTRADGTPDPQVYEQMVLKHGFPGPKQHRIMYIRLKERQLDRLQRDHAGKILFVSGARTEESVRRMGTTNPFQSQGRRAWCAVIHNWKKSECSAVLDSIGAKRNRVVLDFGMSGECLCGSFAHPGELAALEFACPKSAQRIRTLQECVRANGFPWNWDDDAPPKWFAERKQGQTFLLDYDKDETLGEEHLCTSCKWRAL